MSHLGTLYSRDLGNHFPAFGFLCPRTAGPWGGGGEQIPSSLALKLIELRQSLPLTGSVPDYIGWKFHDIEE